MIRRILILAIIGLFFFKTNYAQLENEIQDTRRTVYWIELSLSYVKDPKIKTFKYQVYLKSRRIFVGNLDQFQRAIWRASSIGTYIVDGPFSNRDQAKLAIKVFSSQANKNPQIINDNKTYFWYLIKLEKYQRLNSYKFIHIPAAVAQGTLKDFLMTLETASYNQSVAIGPFSTRLEAELSKRLFRQEE